MNKIYLAPMEGLTGYVYRNAINNIYGGIDKYFTPFIVPTIKREFKSRELRDILPENNKGINVVPQVLSNNSEMFLNTVDNLKNYGYLEVNLNLGCPSGTVVTKFKGAGLLSDLEKLDIFLYEIYEQADVNISIKTRIGMNQEDEFEPILDIYNKYPISELVVHPRLRTDYYKNPIRYDSFRYAYEYSKILPCYNGDINSANNFLNIIDKFPKTKAVMIGRGLIANPNLAAELKYLINGCADTNPGLHTNIKLNPDLNTNIKPNTDFNMNTFKKFHNELINGYKIEMQDDNNVLRKMKEMWFYLERNFPHREKELKKIKKSKKLSEYEIYVNEILS